MVGWPGAAQGHLRPDQRVRASRLTSEIAQFTAQNPIFERHSVPDPAHSSAGDGPGVDWLPGSRAGKVAVEHERQGALPITTSLSGS
jgi:hypothetical protein